MHLSAQIYGKMFFDQYLSSPSGTEVIVDIGSLDVNGSLREHAPSNCQYIGLDFVEGKGVDVVIEDPYSLPLQDNSVDFIVCSSVFEHSDFFWLLFLECLRILKPSGILYVNAPSNGMVHRYPVDSWRFYPDCSGSLVRWGQRNGYKCKLLEAFIAGKEGRISDEGMWNDNIFVVLKDCELEGKHPHRINEAALHANKTIHLTYEHEKFSKTPDQVFINKLLNKITNLEAKIQEKENHISDLELLIANYQRQIEEFLNSSSWKITKPLRKISSIFRAK